MALHKRVKTGGSLYKGYELNVSSSVGNYTVDMSETGAAALNSISITPDGYGSGDTFKLEHLTSDTERVIALLAEDVYNPGANVSTMFDFPALEPLEANEVMRFTYVNTATEALNVHIVLEYVGINRTS